MNKSAPRRFTVFDPAPVGFVSIALSKRHLLGGPLALLLYDFTELTLVLPEYVKRMQGILITPGLKLALNVVCVISGNC